MDPFKNQIDERTSYKSLDEQFHEARLDRNGINQSDWPSQIDRAAIDVCYSVALGTTDSAFDHGGTIGKNDFGGACGVHYVDGLRALAGSQSDLPRLIDEYDASDLGDLAFRLNELRVELEKLELGDSDISDLNRTTEALVEKLITQGSSGDLARQPLQKPEAVADLLYQLFSDPAVTTYANVLIDGITGGTGTSIGSRSLLEHLDRPQMVTPLWDHQQKGIKEWVKAETQGYVNMATATGKTVLGLAAIAHKFGELHPADTDSIPPIEDSVEGRARILIVAGQDLLLKQWQSEFDEHLNIPRSRTVQSQTADANVIELKWGDIEFRTAQELLNNEIQNSYDLVILDEAHRYSSGRRGSRGWRDLFEELIDATDSILAMSGSIDDEWLGDDSVKNALEANLKQCIEFTIEDARKQNVIADFRWDVCYAASDTGETVEGIATSTKPLAAVYNSTQHKFEPHELNEDIPDTVPDQFETLRDLRSFAHTKEGKQARDNNDPFDRFATAAFSRKPKRWQLSPPAETIGQLLEEHLPERKCIVLVQSYAQAEAIGDYLKKQYGDDLITVPEQATDAPYDSITEFKDATQGVLVGPGEVLGVGVDLPNADVAINLAKGGVNASLIQRIGRILRNPTGDKKAHFYQVVAIASNPEARLPGEDGRRLLRRASEFRALGSRFREHPGFVVADSTASEIVRVLETHGSQAKIKDDRPTEKMVEDDVARQFLDELTTEIDSHVGESLAHPVLTTYWKPESLSPGTLPVQESVEQLDADGHTDTESESTSESKFVSESSSTDQPESEAAEQPATLIVDVRDDSGTPVRDASVVIENPSPISDATTDADGEAVFDLPVFSDDVCLFVSEEGYQNYFTSATIDEGKQSLSIELAKQTHSNSMDDSLVDETRVADSNGSEGSVNEDAPPSREKVLTEIRAIDPQSGNIPMRLDFVEQSDMDIKHVYEYFRSWSKAYKASQTAGKKEIEDEISINSTESHETGNQDTQSQIDHASSDEKGDSSTFSSTRNSPSIKTESDADNIDLSNRDLLIELVSLTQQIQRVPTQDEINEYTEFTYDEYISKFGDLYEAAQQAGITEDSVTRSEFFGMVTQSEFTSTEKTNNVDSEPIDESKGVNKSKNNEKENIKNERSRTSGDTESSSLSTSDFAELTGFQRDILIILAGSTGKSGSDIKDTLEQYYDSEVNHGRLYPNLDSLIELGYVVKQSVDGRTNSYALTELGHSLIDSRKKWVTNRAPEAQLETTEANTQENIIDLTNPSWRAAVRREVERYQQTHDDRTVSISQIYDFSEKRLTTQFPDNNNIRAKIRQQLQRLRDEGDVESLDQKGHYRIQINTETDSDQTDSDDFTDRIIDQLEDEFENL